MFKYVKNTTELYLCDSYACGKNISLFNIIWKFIQYFIYKLNPAVSWRINEAKQQHPV